MNYSLKKLQNDIHIEIPADLIKFQNLTELDLLNLKKLEKDYLEVLTSRLKELKVLSTITDENNREIAEREINNSVTHYLFKHQAGTFNYKNKVEFLKEYIPLVKK